MNPATANFHFWEKFPFQHITSSLPEIIPKQQVGKGNLRRSSTVVSSWFFFILKSWKIPSILLQLTVTQVNFRSQNQTWESSRHTDCSIEWKVGGADWFSSCRNTASQGETSLQSLELYPVSWFTYWLIIIIIIESFKHHPLSLSPGSSKS